MIGRASVLSVLVVSTLLLSAGSKAETSMITLESLEEMFDSIAAKTSWDLSRPMLWGYFFTADSQDELEQVAPLLEAQGLKVVNIYLSEKESPAEPDTWWLHVEKVEIHSPVSLHERNLEYYEFADANNLSSYDGMDVGPAPVQ